MSLITLVATCYYPHRMEAVPQDRKSFWRHRKIVVHHHRSVDDPRVMAKTTLWVTRDDAKRARIEASALVDVSQVPGLADTANPTSGPKLWGIAYHGRRWHLYADAPFGVGNRMNPLVPGRDFAHRIRGGWPHGTKVELLDIPGDLRGLVRPTMYRGGCFGKKTTADRVDLFVKRPCYYKGKIKVKMTRPWDGVSSRPVKGAQEALELMGYDLPRYGVDGMMGEETQAALEVWADEYGVKVDTPGRIHPRDAEIAYLVREAARRHKREGG